MKPIAPLLRDLSLAALFLFATPSPANEPREWSDAQGRKIQASFVSSDGATVVLKSARSGKELQVPLQQLSLADQAEILRLVEASKPKDPVPDQPTPPAPVPESPDPADLVLPPLPLDFMPGDLDDGMTDEEANEAGQRADREALKGLKELETLVEGHKPPNLEPQLTGMLTFMKPMRSPADALALLSKLEPRRLAVTLLAAGIVWVLVYALGLHITSAFMSFKETFGTAMLVAVGSAGFRVLTTVCFLGAARMVPAVAEFIRGPLYLWATTALLFYPFDVFFIRRVYHEGLGTGMKAGFIYIAWGNLLMQLLVLVNDGLMMQP